jgi:hypothetical protein
MVSDKRRRIETTIIRRRKDKMRTRTRTALKRRLEREKI